MDESSSVVNHESESSGSPIEDVDAISEVTDSAGISSDEPIVDPVSDSPLTAGELTQKHGDQLPTKEYAAESSGLDDLDDTVSVRREPYEVGTRIEGRYEIQEQIGAGGFGRVFRARDIELNRPVAIKQSSGLISFVAGRVRDEAKAVASLSHPGIVSIYDLITISKRELLIVMECLSGCTLTDHLKKKNLTLGEVAQIVLQVAEALKHAHNRKLVHSDIKPSNLFVTDDGNIKLLDFGLAVAYFPDDMAGRLGGTPGYMSPEQIRGESHRIDGRADIFALGVVMYLMLTNTRPFVGPDGKAVLLATLKKEVPPPRQFNTAIDPEMQRIVLRCLEKRMSDRYDSAQALIDDLTRWQQSYMGQALVSVSHPGSDLSSRNESSVRSSKISVRSRGLQPYTEDDTDAYLELIPGPRDHSGLPESILFWRHWVHSDQPDKEHPVGVLYGPSGSGKSSYVRAGLIPNLGPGVCTAYVECRPGDLADRIIRIIASQIPSEKNTGSSLRDVLTRLRSDESSHPFRKLLIVFDQFEAWSREATLEERRDFAEALRQCDGQHIRALVVIRDDYWMAATEFLKWLEIPLQEGRNIASVDLLDRDHASRILEAIGRESGTLPKSPEPLSSKQSQFITQAIDELSVGGSVICVHLVMFSQMLRLQDWSPRGLKAAGGVSGACSLFFQELFTPTSGTGSRSPEYRRVAPAVLPILEALLPLEGDSVMTNTKTKAELAALLAGSGHGHLLEDCLRILGEDVCVIGVVQNDYGSGVQVDGVGETANHTQYRLSHDFLVQPIRQWIDRTKKQTLRGRVGVRLNELSRSWATRPGSGTMPGYVEYLTLVAMSPFGTKKNATQRSFLRAATRHHSGRISMTALALLAFVGMSIVAWHQRSEAIHARQESAESRRSELASKIDALIHGPAGDIKEHMADLDKFGSDAVDALRPWSNSLNPEASLRANLYLQSQLTSFSQLASGIETAPTEYFEPIAATAKRMTDAPAVLKLLSDSKSSIASARAAALLVELGDTSVAESYLQGTDDAKIDCAFLTEVSRFHGSAKPWATLFTQTDDDDIRYHTGVVLGSFRKEQLRAEEIGLDYEPLINHPKASMHSMGRFLATHMGDDVSTIAVQPPANANWKIGPESIPMRKIDAGEYPFYEIPRTQDEPHIGKVVVNVWFAMQPVTRRLYKEFLDDPAPLADGKTDRVEYLPEGRMPVELQGDLSYPISNIDLRHAVSFCNWLSKRNGLQPVYSYNAERDKKQEDGFYHNPWTPNLKINGYRLPTYDEFNVAVRSTYNDGIPWLHVLEIGRAGGDYEEYLGNAYPRRFDTLIPNRWGLFINDPICGSWLTGNVKGMFIRTNLHLNALPYHRYNPESALHRAPLESIYLVQNDSQ
ncbi:serine/threonine-protein kinase [Stieleria varia]|uniref:Serine/threonine-protein kinase PrkC n=1 Tax=Stieleria varia TaxID=2528005 RepID=A0A5C6A066_9BACT|nr:serine/threonine-protein kinase [Stieleria varia]TWT92795.1 Serine/threonine-protein kinase PrkC [Stieleria varia]